MSGCTPRRSLTSRRCVWCAKHRCIGLSGGQTSPNWLTGSISNRRLPAIEVKKLFAAQCGWCHAEYGMKPGKAPQLAGTQMTEKQVHDRIRDGKTDAMGFRRTLTEEQLQAFTTYIKGLKAPE